LTLKLLEGVCWQYPIKSKAIDNISKKEYYIRENRFIYDVDYYKLPNGDKPVEQFINSLDIKMCVKALGCIDILAEFGHTLREPYSKAMGNGLFELRIKFATDITRIFYFFVVDNKIILTNGFVKKTKKRHPIKLPLPKSTKPITRGGLQRNERL